MVVHFAGHKGTTFDDGMEFHFYHFVWGGGKYVFFPLLSPKTGEEFNNVGFY